MAILRCGNSIRLNGADAVRFLLETERTTLPKTVMEYNLAMQEMRAFWQLLDTPDSRLLAAVCFEELPVEDSV